MVKVKNILVYTTSGALSKLISFKVETKTNKCGPWELCKGPYTPEGDYRPHVVQCDNTTFATHLRLSNTKFLLLIEVKVEGYGKNTPL